MRLPSHSAMDHLTHLTLALLCFVPSVLTVITVNWDPAVHNQSFNIDSNVVLKCLAKDVEVTDVVKIVKVVVINGYSEEWTVVTKGVLSYPYHTLSRYDVHYEYIQNQREGILELFINGLQLEDGAKYKCFAGSPFEKTKPINVIIPVPLDDLHLTQIQGMDSVGTQVTEGATVMIRPGRSAGVSCVLKVVGSDIQPVVEVSVSGNAIFNMSDLDIRVNKTVTPLTEPASGYYSHFVTYHYVYLRDNPEYTLHGQTMTCQGHTPGYEGQQQTQSVLLDVQFKPVFRCSHNEVYGKRGRPAELQCTVFSRPSPKLSATWGYTGVPQGSVRQSGISGPFSLNVKTYQSDIESTVTFSISSLEKLHFGYAYLLTASNNHGSSKVEFTVKEGVAPWQTTGGCSQVSAFLQMTAHLLFLAMTAHLLLLGQF